MKNLKTFYLLILVLVLLPYTNIDAQVTIGSGEIPSKGALLELKEYKPTDLTKENSTADKGMLYPRVNLTDNNNLFPMFEDDGNGGYKIGTISYSKSDEDKKHIGLIVYNVNASSVFHQGLHIWDGKEWRKLDSSPVIQPEISSLMCRSKTMSPNEYKANQFFEGLLTIPYLGGNGGSYMGTDPVSIGNGLFMERVEGKLALGGGQVTYRIFGIPTISTPDTTNFNINFLEKECNDISIGSGDIVSVYVKNLTKSQEITAQRPDNGDASGATKIPFEEIEISETGSYAFSIRLYGRINRNDGTYRLPFYIYLQKEGNLSKIEDSAELDLVVVKQADASWQDYSYSVTLAGFFLEGDKVIISMHKPGLASWTLSKGDSRNSPIRTSLVYWKL